MKFRVEIPYPGNPFVTLAGSFTARDSGARSGFPKHFANIIKATSRIY